MQTLIPYVLNEKKKQSLIATWHSLTPDPARSGGGGGGGAGGYIRNISIGIPLNLYIPTEMG